MRKKWTHFQQKLCFFLYRTTLSSVHYCEDHFPSQVFRLMADEEWGEYEKKDWVDEVGECPR